MANDVPSRPSRHQGRTRDVDVRLKGLGLEVPDEQKEQEASRGTSPVQPLGHPGPALDLRGGTLH